MKTVAIGFGIMAFSAAVVVPLCLLAVFIWHLIPVGAAMYIIAIPVAIGGGVALAGMARDWGRKTE